MYFHSGIEATLHNSQLANQGSYIGLYLTSNRGFTQSYYFRAKSTSINPPYSNSVNSRIFTINVKSDPSVVNNEIYIQFNKTINYVNFASKAIYEYLPGGNCSIQNTTIIMNGFNPNFIFYYESGNSIKVTFKNFTTNNTYCIV